MQLRGLQPGRFLAETWQQRPQLFHGALPGFRSPLSPEELAGLACEDDIEARLVIHDPKHDHWSLEHGPFAETRFASLPPDHWTLLVQAVDHWHPEVAALLNAFRFIPGWRIDDVMVSYATRGGSVGPHFDQYDVFLIQGLGQRRWHVGAHCDHHTPLREQVPLRQLQHFSAEQSWLLEPGDMLYLPPGVAHHGIAESDHCMTFSVGFRAPSMQTLLSGWCDHLLAADTERLFADPRRPATRYPGRLGEADITRLQALLREAVADRAGLAHWLGAQLSEPKYPRPPARRTMSTAALQRALSRRQLLRAAASRWLYRVSKGNTELFVDGHAYTCEGACAALAQGWCDAPLESPLPVPDTRCSAQMTLTRTLLARGALEWNHD